MSKDVHVTIEETVVVSLRHVRDMLCR